MSALSRRVSAFASKVSLEDIMRAHDTLGLRRLPVVTAVRALAAVGLTLRTDEAATLFAPFLVPSTSPNEVRVCTRMLEGGGRGGSPRAYGRRVWAAAPAMPRNRTTAHPPPPLQLNYLAFAAAFNDTIAPGVMEAGSPCAASVAAAAAARAAASAITVSPVAAGSAGAFAPLSAAEALALDALLGSVRHSVATRGLALQLYLREFDATHRGAITATQFQRTLSATLPGLSAADLSLLTKAYASADGIDARYIVFSNDVTVADDAQAADAAAAAAAASWPKYAGR